MTTQPPPPEISAVGSYPTLWDEVRATGLVPMGVAEMGLPGDPAVAATLQHLASGPLLYPAPYTAGPVGEALATFYRREYGIDTEPRAFWLTAGIVSASHALAAHWMQPGDEAIYFAPSYHSIPEAIRGAGARAVPVRLDPFTRPAWDVGELRAAITPRTRAIFLCHPHNPTGHAFARSELEVLAAVAREHGLQILSNELHARLWLDAPHVPMQEVAPDLTVTVSGATKSHNLAGLGGGFVTAADADLVDSLRAALGRKVAPARALQQQVIRAAYAEPSDWLPSLRRGLRASRDALATALATRFPQVRVHQPAATYFLWLDQPGTQDAPSLADVLARDAGVQALGGEAFGGTASQARLVHAVDGRLLDHVLTRLREGAAGLAYSNRPIGRVKGAEDDTAAADL